MEVRVTILDATGAAVASVQKIKPLEALSRGEVSQRVSLVQPHLWDGLRDPYLYQVRTEVLVNGVVRDALDQPLGVRFFSVDPDKGFMLNGRPLELRGVNRHQDREGLGWAIGETEDLEDMALILELGCNAVRTSHYQQSPLWYDLANGKGVILWTEIPFINDVVDTPEFFENCREQLRELIRQNYNQPSILFWGIGNETFVRNEALTAADANDRLLRELAAVVREEDSTRLSSYASNGNVTEKRATFTDVVGFNQYFGWYHDAPEDFISWLDQQHALRPDLKIAMSEYGAGANPDQHETSARKPVASSQWHPEEWQSHFHEVYWQALAQRPWVWGKFIWCMFDLASDGRNEGGVPGRNDKGLVTFDRKTKKDAFFWYKANWSDQPVLYITSRRFTPRTEASTSVKIYSNAKSVELSVNGASRGKQTSRNHIFVWANVTLVPGENHVEARAEIAGQKMTDRCTWRYVPVTTRAPVEPAVQPSASGNSGQPTKIRD
jgi:beta-galactosidase